MAGTQSDLSDGEKWQRAKAYIEREIESHQRAIDAGGISYDAFYTHAIKRDIYRTMLDRAEGGTMDSDLVQVPRKELEYLRQVKERAEELLEAETQKTQADNIGR